MYTTKAFTFKSLGRPSALACKAWCLFMLFKPANVGLVLHPHYPLSLPQCSFSVQHCPLFGFHSCLQGTLIEWETPMAENSLIYSRVLSSARSYLSVQFTTWLHEIWTGQMKEWQQWRKVEALKSALLRKSHQSTPLMSLIYLSEAQRQKLVWVCYFWTIVLTYCLCNLKNIEHLSKEKQTGFQAFTVDMSHEWQQVHKPSLKCKHLCKHFLEFLFPGSPVVYLTIGSELSSRVETWCWRGFDQSHGMSFYWLCHPPRWLLGNTAPSSAPGLVTSNWEMSFTSPFSLSPEIKSLRSKCTQSHTLSHIPI